MIDVNDPDEVEAAEQREKLARQREVEGFRRVLDTEFGREFVWRLLSRCKIFDQIQVIDPLQMAKELGVANFGKWLIHEVFTSDPNAYSIMQSEATTRERNSNGGTE